MAAGSAVASDDVLEQATAGVYSAPGLYEPTVIRYDNGLTLIAKHRPGIRTVSVRVDVGIGMAHYACGRQHVPHFLEHMLFASVPGMSESELERRFFELGASANAYTGTLHTVYEVDVFSGTATEALGLTADMITNAELQQESFDRTKKTIWREMGGEPGPVEKQQFVGGELASGVTQAAADVSARHFQRCGARHAGQAIAFEVVRDAYERYYVAARTTWTVVGEFEKEALRAWAARQLGSLPTANKPPPDTPEVTGFAQAEYTGFGSEPGVWVLSTTDGLTGEAYYARAFIAHLLDERLYERLRLDAALTYTPGAYRYEGPDWGIFGIQADVEAGDHDEALGIIRGIIQELVAKPLAPPEFRAVQLSLLREWAQAIETNRGYADHYIASLRQFRRDGGFINDEVQVATLTPERMHQFAKRLFADERTVVIRDKDIQTQIGAQNSE